MALEGGWSLQGVLQTYMERVHAPAVTSRGGQLAVLLLFTTTFFLSLCALPRLSVGLDQSVALPRDSYLQDYYTTLLTQLRVGPPLYIVLRNLSVDPQQKQIDKVCAVAGCRTDSLMNKVSAAARDPGRSWVATPAASWLDDFLAWLSPALGECCRQHQGAPHPASADAYCPPPDQPPCSTAPAECADCRQCAAEMEGARPSTPAVQRLLGWFLTALPSEHCAKGGAGAYSTAIQRNTSEPSDVAGLSVGRVAASHFRAYYAPLNSQQDFISALRAVRRMVADAAAALDLDLYAYSVFHVFFEQYLHAGREALLLVALPCAAVVAVVAAFTGSAAAAALLAALLGSTLVHLGAAMLLAGIQVNAVSLVNLAMALGIAVEFHAHVLHAFLMARNGGRAARAAAALRSVGASVLSGITLTKIAGVAVLAAARTEIFEVYYFRLYAALVVIGAAHGLVLLPVVLALIGPLTTGRQRKVGWAPLRKEGGVVVSGGGADVAALE